MFSFTNCTVLIIYVNMKFVITLFLTALFAYALGLYAEWWSIAIAAFIVAVCIPQRPWLAFLSGFAGIALLWGTYSIFLNQRNSGLLASKIAYVLPLGGTVPLLIFITAFIGGIVGGLAALSGSYLRKTPASKSVSGKGNAATKREVEIA